MTLDWLFRKEKDEDRIVARDRRPYLLELVREVIVRDVTAVATLADAPTFVPLGPTAALYGPTTRRAMVGGRVRTFAVSDDGKRIYAGTPGGLWYSADSGRRWQPLDAGASSSAIDGDLHDARALPVSALLVIFGAAETGEDDQVVIGTGDVAFDTLVRPVGCRGIGIRTATGPAPEVVAGNDPWTLEAKNLAGSVVLALARDLAGVLWAATTEGLFQRPAGAGDRDSWDRVLLGLCWDVAVTAGDGVEPQRLWVASEGSLRWTANGNDFHDVALPDDFPPAEVRRPAVGRLRLHATPGAAPLLWVVGPGSRLWRVTAAGASPVGGVPLDLSGFGEFDDSDRGLTVSCSPTDADDVVVAGGLGRMSHLHPAAAVYRGKVAQRGGRWQFIGGDALETRTAPVVVGIGVAAHVHAVAWASAVAPAPDLWLGTDGGVFRSRNGSGAFESMNWCLPSFEIEHLADHPRAEALLLGTDRAVGAVQAAGPATWITTMIGGAGGATFDPADARRVAVQDGAANWYLSINGYAFSPVSWFVPPVRATASVLRAFSEANHGEGRHSAPASIPAATIGPGGVTQLAIGTRRVWFSENWGTTWRTLPSIDQDPSALGPDGGGPRVDQDLTAGQVRVLRWGSPDRLYALTTDAVYLYQRPAAGGAPTSWEQHMLYDGPELKPKKRKSRGDQIPPEMPRTNLTVHDPARGQFGSLYATTARSFEDDDERHVWWYDGMGNWFECGLDVAVPAYAAVVDPDNPANVFVANAIGVYRGVFREPAVPGDPPTWSWRRFSQGMPEAPCVDLAIHVGSRVLRVAVFGCGTFEAPLDVPQVEPATIVFLRAHEYDLRRAAIPVTPRGPIPRDGQARPYADVSYEPLRLDASPDIRVRRAPGEPSPALVDHQSGFASGDPQRKTFEAYAIEAALQRSGDAIVPVSGLEDGEFQPAVERWLQRDETNTAAAWNETTGRGELGNICPIDAEVVVAGAATIAGQRTSLTMAGAFAGPSLDNLVVRFANDVTAVANRGMMTRVTSHTDDDLDFVEIPEAVAAGDRFEILRPTPGHAVAAAATVMESDPDGVSSCRTHAGRVLVDVTVHTRTGPIAANRVAIALLRVPFAGLSGAPPAPQLPEGWADSLRGDLALAAGVRGAWLADGWSYFDALQEIRELPQHLSARNPQVVTFEGTLADGQWLLCAVAIAVDDQVANASRDPFAIERTSRQVALRSVNAIAQPIVQRHAFFEWHQNAAADVAFTPPVGSPTDRRIVQRAAGAGERLRPKTRLHLCFLEHAAAAFELNGPPGAWTASWSIVDRAGAVVAQHPDFRAAGAVVAPGSYVWKWDGRRDPPGGAGAPPRGRIVPAGPYRSRLILRLPAAGGRPAREFTFTAKILAEGKPYNIYIEGVPKNDEEIRQMIAARGRAFSVNGARIPHYCWISTYRGQIDDGHAVFLGQGIVEATAVTTGPGTAVATPHDRVYKCWIRDRGVNADRCQLEDIGRFDGHIMLDNLGGLPPLNPRFDLEGALAPPQPRKNNVQVHAVWAGAAVWTTDGTTAGCAAVAPLGPTVSERGLLRSVSSEFGNWGALAAEDPTLTSPTFVNKQTKRAAANAVADALLADDHARPALEPLGAAAADREPLHNQPEMQQGICGGFIQGEIPVTDNVIDDPARDANAAPNLRIRCVLRDYRRGSAYHLYHHGVVVKHEHRTVGADYEVDIWIPRKVIRGWNSPLPGEDHDPASVRRALANREFGDPLPTNRRNVLVAGRLQIRWYIRHTDAARNQNIVHRLFPVAPVPVANFAAQAPGRWRERWPGAAAPGALAAGDYDSVCEYQLQIEPHAAADHDWHPELAVSDALSTVVPPAQISEETVRRVPAPAGLLYFDAESVLRIVTVP